MVGDGDHHGVNVLARNHFSIIVIGLAAFVLVKAIDHINGLLEMFLVDVAGSDHLAIVQTHQAARIVRRNHAPPNDAHGDSLRWGRTPSATQRGGGNESRNCKCGASGAGYSEETAAAHG